MLLPTTPESPLSGSTVTLDYRPRGASQAVFACREPEVLLSGPAGTGKSRAILEKVHLACLKYPGVRALMVRKTRRSLTESGMVTYQEKVVHPLDGVVWKSSVQQYQYPNGSILAVGGLDKPGKIMSSEWDLVYAQEATELSENDWEAITTRLRNGRMPYQQLLGDCNPDAPTHWLLRRTQAGKTVLLHSWHEDNPTLWNAEQGDWTSAGAVYLAKLNALSGVRHARLRLGLWAAAEGMVYQDAWNPERHLIPRQRYTQRPDLWGDCGIDPTWPRYLGIDWGYRNPAVIQWFARLPDGELLLYRELYVTMTIVEDLAREALALMGWRMSETGALVQTRAHADPLPREIIADHDAEDRATFERHFGLGVFPADKGKNSISDGIQAVTKRLQDNRLLILADSLARRDPLLEEAKRPCSTVEEFESYVWDTRAGRPPKEQPIDDHNHGMDALRYVVRYFDRDEPNGGSIEFQAIGF